jgi:hypothetical protein
VRFDETDALKVAFPVPRRPERAQDPITATADRLLTLPTDRLLNG